MRSFAVLALAALTSLVTAQTATSPLNSAATGCAAQNIVDTCVSGYQERIKACEAKSNDWVCLCDVYTDVLTCYNNCPDNNEKSPVQNQVTSFCQAAAPAKSAILASLISAASTRTSTAPPTSAPTGSQTIGTVTGAASSATRSPGAGNAVPVPVGGVMAVLFGLAGLL